MIVSTHDLNLAAALCERIVLLKQGKVLAQGADAGDADGGKHPIALRR